MQHLLLILLVAVLGYVLWAVADKYARKAGLHFITHHGLRLGGLVLLVLLLLAAASHLPAINILALRIKVLKEVHHE